MSSQGIEFAKDIKMNACLYGGVALILGGAMFHYPSIFAGKAKTQALQAASDQKTEWACKAIEAQAPLLVNESGAPLTLKNGTAYYGASQDGDMSPIPVGTVIQDAMGNAGQMVMGAEGVVVMKVIGSCPSMRGRATVTTMGTDPRTN